MKRLLVIALAAFAALGAHDVVVNSGSMTLFGFHLSNHAVYHIGYYAVAAADTIAIVALIIAPLWLYFWLREKYPTRNERAAAAADADYKAHDNPYGHD